MKTLHCFSLLAGGTVQYVVIFNINVLLFLLLCTVLLFLRTDLVFNLGTACPWQNCSASLRSDATVWCDSVTLLYRGCIILSRCRLIVQKGWTLLWLDAVDYSGLRRCIWAVSSTLPFQPIAVRSSLGRTMSYPRARPCRIGAGKTFQEANQGAPFVKCSLFRNCSYYAFECSTYCLTKEVTWLFKWYEDYEVIMKTWL